MILLAGSALAGYALAGSALAGLLPWLRGPLVDAPSGAWSPMRRGGDCCKACNSFLWVAVGELLAGAASSLLTIFRVAATGEVFVIDLPAFLALNAGTLQLGRSW